MYVGVILHVAISLPLIIEIERGGPTQLIYFRDRLPRCYSLTTLPEQDLETTEV